MDGLAAVATDCFDLETQVFLPELPLHEGRRDRVDRSGGVELFPRAESDLVGRLFHRDRVSPGHLALLIAEQEGQAVFQFLQDDLDPLERKIEALGDPLGRDRPAVARQLAHHQVTHGVVIGRHELERMGPFLGALVHLPAPQVGGDGDQVPPESQEKVFVHGCIILSGRSRMDLNKYSKM